MTLREQMARAIKLCDVCDGEGTVCDGMDEAGCSMPCPVCFGTGDDVTAALNLIRDPSDEMVERCAEAMRRVPAYDGDFSVAADAGLTGDEIRNLARACLAAAVGGE